jgi:chaperone BCS1
MKIESILGFVVFAISGAVLYLLRSLPGKLIDFILWKYTCSVVIYSEDEIFPRASCWMARLPYCSNARHVKMESFWNRITGLWVENVSPGPGFHVIKINGRYIFIRREISKESISEKRKEEIKITTIGPSSVFLNSIVDEIKNVSYESNRLSIYIYDGRWVLRSLPFKRDLGTVIVNSIQKNRIISAFDTFVCSSKWYMDHGVPYKLGALFHGPSGTGKSSLALAIASYLDFSVYLLNIGMIRDDSDLLTAMSSVPCKSIVIIEDVDCFSIKRSFKDKDEAKNNVSLSSFLNILDGPLMSHGQIVIMTTNHIEQLDDALIRPSRIDLCEHIGMLDVSETYEMLKLFNRVDLKDNINTPISGAALMNYIMPKIV